jgi:archaellum component FlaC
MDVNNTQLQAIGQILNVIEKTTVLLAHRLGELGDTLSEARADLEALRTGIACLQGEVEDGTMDLDCVATRLSLLLDKDY